MAGSLNKPLVWLKGEVKTPPFQCRGSGRSRIYAAQIAERGESWSAAFTANAIGWLAMS